MGMMDLLSSPLASYGDCAGRYHKSPLVFNSKELTRWQNSGLSNRFQHRKRHIKRLVGDKLEVLFDECNGSGVAQEIGRAHV